MHEPRTFRKLFVVLAVLGLTADLGGKYGVFRWLYHDGVPFADGPAAFATWQDGARGEYNLVPGWFKFSTEFDLKTPPDADWRQPLQTASAPVRPRVNHGALFGVGGEHKWLANGIFAGISVLAAVAIIGWASKRVRTADPWLSVALGLILGGTLGNLYDRVVFGGVRDFLYFYKIEWPVFNIADCCLVAGAGLLLVQALVVPSAKPQPAAPPVAEPVAAK